ncbi:MAG TPA: hypothetical protein VFX22_09655, partial [Candidatus Kapabacteria bacterium]|nr:hypothetical protein [Candidatus Kapabacteria bacterium]
MKVRIKQGKGKGMGQAVHVIHCALFILTLSIFAGPAIANDSPFFKGDVQGPLAQEGLPKIVQHVAFDQHLGTKVTLNMPVRDENGHVTTLGAYFGRMPVILVMAYYSCPHL